MARRGFFSEDDFAPAPGVGRQPQCGPCGLYKYCHSPKMPVSGRGEKGILIVAEAPGKNEDDQNRPLVGDAGQYLHSALSRLGVDMRRDCWLTNAIVCRPRNNATPTEKQIGYCRPNVINAIRERKPALVLLFGASAVKSVLGWLYKDKVGAFGRWLGWRIPSTQLNAWVAANYHPSYLLRMQDRRGKDDPVLALLFEKYLRRALAKQGRPFSEVPDYSRAVKIIYDPRRAAAEVESFTQAGRPVAFDYETQGLKPDGGRLKIFSCALSDGERAVAYPWAGEAVEATRRFLQSSVPKIGANCFSGDTRFLSREEGMVTLQEAVGKRLTILNHEGRWVPAVVRCFGEQDTVEVTFSRRNVLNTVRATDGHEWILAEGGPRIRTDQLRHRIYGDRARSRGFLGAEQVPYLFAPKVIEDEEDYLRGIKHGIIYGDGSKEKAKKAHFKVRLCGEKAVLLPYFKEHTVGYYRHAKGDPTVTLVRQIEELKEVPSTSSSDSYLIGFARGLLATDGCVNHAGQISVSGGTDIVRWCEKCLPKVGYLFQGKSHANKYEGRYDRGDFGPLTKDNWTLYFSRESVTEDDLLKPSHRKKYRKVSLGPWKFRGRGERRTEPVYCAVVPDGHSFTLDGGLVTGNCKYEDRFTRAAFGHGVNGWTWDTVIAAHVLDNRPGIAGVKFQAFSRLGVACYDAKVRPYLRAAAPGCYSPNRIQEADLRNVLLYNGLDSLLEFKIAELQAKELKLTLGQDGPVTT